MDPPSNKETDAAVGSGVSNNATNVQSTVYQFSSTTGAFQITICDNNSPTFSVPQAAEAHERTNTVPPVPAGGAPQTKQRCDHSNNEKKRDYSQLNLPVEKESGKKCCVGNESLTATNSPSQATGGKQPVAHPITAVPPNQKRTSNVPHESLPAITTDAKQRLATSKEPIQDVVIPVPLDGKETTNFVSQPAKKKVRRARIVGKRVAAKEDLYLLKKSEEQRKSLLHLFVKDQSITSFPTLFGCIMKKEHQGKTQNKSMRSYTYRIHWDGLELVLPSKEAVAEVQEEFSPTPKHRRLLGAAIERYESITQAEKEAQELMLKFDGRMNDISNEGEAANKNGASSKQSVIVSPTNKNNAASHVENVEQAQVLNSHGIAAAMNPAGESPSHVRGTDPANHTNPKGSADVSVAPIPTFQAPPTDSSTRQTCRIVLCDDAFPPDEANPNSDRESCEDNQSQEVLFEDNDSSTSMSSSDSLDQYADPLFDTQEQERENVQEELEKDDSADTQPEEGLQTDDDKEDNTWKFVAVSDPYSATHPPALPQQTHMLYTGPGGLKPGIEKLIQTPLDAMEYCGGFTRRMIEDITYHSNTYANANTQYDPKTKKYLFAGFEWRKITLKEMYNFLGVILRISCESRTTGGYEIYFSEGRYNTIQVTSHQSIHLDGFYPWARGYFTLYRFKQIRAAYRPENEKPKIVPVGKTGRTQLSDKCYQLRSIINSLNKSSREAFHVNRNLAFDEGGIPIRSRFCPVRMYNKDKPDKFRVDFFVLADCTTKHIVHLDVYQGKNSQDVGIHEDAVNFPTTQKAVLNAIIKGGVSNDPAGYRIVTMDNRYSALNLFRVLRDEHKVLAQGTIRKNRKGMPKILETMIGKKADRGATGLMYDEVNRMAVLIWKDSKVMRVLSTNIMPGMKKVFRQSGRTWLEVDCHQMIVNYQKHMNAVDVGDKYRMIGAGWGNKGHFKKWYKKISLGIFDFMLLNAWVGWQMVAEIDKKKRTTKTSERRNPLSKQQFNAVVAQMLLLYQSAETPILEGIDSKKGVAARTRAKQACVSPEDSSSIDPQAAARGEGSALGRLHREVPPPDKKPGERRGGGKRNSRYFCKICSFENGIKKEAEEARVGNQTNDIAGMPSRAGRYNFSFCFACNGAFHRFHQDNLRLPKIVDASQKLGCYDLAHHPDCKGLIREYPGRGHNPDHLMARLLRKEYGLPATPAKRSYVRRKSGGNTEEE